MFKILKNRYSYNSDRVHSAHVSHNEKRKDLKLRKQILEDNIKLSRHQVECNGRNNVVFIRNEIY